MDLHWRKRDYDWIAEVPGRNGVTISQRWNRHREASLTVSGGRFCRDYLTTARPEFLNDPSGLTWVSDDAPGLCFEQLNDLIAHLWPSFVREREAA